MLELEKVIRAKDKMLATYERQIKSLSDFAGGKGKVNSTMSLNEIKRNAESEVHEALTMISFFVSSKVWGRTKFFPDRWDHWNTSPRSACQILMDCCNELLPKHWLPIVFWHLYAAPFANSCLITKRTASVAAIKIIFKGKRRWW